MNEEGGGDTGDTNSSLVESIDVDSCGGQDVLSKDDRVAS